jgi:signal transduction histidine kinase
VTRPRRERTEAPLRKRAAKAPKAKSREALRPPTRAAVMAAAFQLARELSLDAREEELVGAFASALRGLLPGRHLCLRVVDPRTLRLSALVAEGPLDPSRRREIARAPLAVKRSALRQTRLPEGVAATGRVSLVERYEPIFADVAGGFSIPLVAAGELFGLLNVEYPRRPELATVEEPLVIPLANQLSVALRNLHLLGEARYYRDYLRRVIDVANALIVVVDRDGRVAVMNAAMQRYLGLDAAPIGEPATILGEASGAGGGGLAALLLDGLEGREHTDREVVVARAGGAPGRALFNTSTLRAVDGGIDGVLGIGQDVARVRSLEHQVIQAEKLATLGQLAAGVVHELNNPLTSISVYGDYLVRLLERVRDGAQTPSAADVDKARRITEGASRIQKLTRDLMSYARPSPATGARDSLQVNDVVRQALGFCEHITRRAQAVVVTDLAEGLPRVQAAPTQLHQVLINLVTNACHALPAPDQQIRVSTSWDPSTREIIIEVADTGVGIDELDRPHVFEPFFTTKEDGKGTGLGLSIVKNIVEGHGGHISFESQIGVGTTFRVALPAAPDSES